MGSELAMRLRTLIELLAALILTFAALFAVSKMARTTGMKVDNAYAQTTIVEANASAVYMTLNDVESESDRLGCAATNADRCAAGIDSPYSDG
jgi:copper(I)-binding protein